jgi:hypothetical protein
MRLGSSESFLHGSSLGERWPLCRITDGRNSIPGGDPSISRWSRSSGHHRKRGPRNSVESWRDSRGGCENDWASHGIEEIHPVAASQKKMSSMRSVGWFPGFLEFGLFWRFGSPVGDRQVYLLVLPDERIWELVSKRLEETACPLLKQYDFATNLFINT